MTDEEIVDMVLRGNTHVFSALVDRYKERVFNMVYRFTNDYNEAQDLSQEVFIQLYKTLHQYSNKSKFSTWLYRLSYNLCIDWTRKIKKDRKNLCSETDTQGDHIVNMMRSDVSVEDDYLTRVKVAALRKAINELKEKYRTVIILYHYQGLSYEEISDILKTSVRTVETRMYRARNLLRKNLLKENAGGDFFEVPSSS